MAEIPAWVFDRAGYAHAASVTAKPFVGLDALAALSALLDLALKDWTPSRASHRQAAAVELESAAPATSAGSSCLVKSAAPDP